MYLFEIDHGELTGDQVELQGYFDRLPSKKEINRAVSERIRQLLEEHEAADYYSELVQGATLVPRSFRRRRKHPATVSTDYTLGSFVIFARAFKVDTTIQSWT